MVLILGQGSVNCGTGGSLFGLSDMWKKERLLPTLCRAFSDA